MTRSALQRIRVECIVLYFIKYKVSSTSWFTLVHVSLRSCRSGSRQGVIYNREVYQFPKS